MSSRLFFLWFNLLGILCSFAYDGPSYGQAVVADETTGTTVSESAPFIVTGGSQQLTTLFHSFQEFSPDAANVLFQLNRSQDVVDTVISRVTGANTSFINGQLQLTGGNAPDLFLLNPNGIIFGANAELVLPGSFFVSTADRILFEDGLSFSSNLDAAPLLTVSAPVGLAFGDKANAVTINQSSLSLEPEQTLGIVGGDIQLTGSNVNISNGTLLLGSVAVGNQIDIDDRGFNYSTVSAFQDIALTDGTFVDVSGDGGGHFQIQGRVFSVVSDSVLEASNLGATDGGTVTIQTSDRVDIDGAFSNVFVDAFGQGRGNQLTVETNEFQLSGYAFMTTDTFSSGDSGGIAVQANTVSILGEANEDGRFTLLSSDTYDSGQAGNVSIESNQLLINGDNAIVRLTSFDQGDAGDLSISADQLALDRGGIIAGSDDFASGNGGDLDLDVRTLKLTNGAQIASGTLGNGQAGDINIVATERIDIWGLDVIDDNFVLTGIIASAESGSTGNAGDITIVTPQLSLFRGSQIASSATGEGDSGDLRIRAGDIEIADNISETQFFVTGIVADVLNEATGNGGSIDIEVNRLSLERGGQINTSTEAMGNAGTVTIRAGEIDLVGRSRTGPLVSSISSQSTTEADAGSVNLSADRISIRENAEISVSSLAGGDAGSITVLTEDLFLDNGILEARVMAGTQGDIDVDAKRLLLMRRGSRITTDAIGMVTGGDIRLTVPVLVGLENSDIVANAVNGDGGSVGITTQGILGFALRNQLTPNSDITASSEFGINGTVEINSFGTNFDANLVKLQTELFDASDQVVQGCGAEGRSEFVVTGRGGVPIPPNTPLRVESTWSDTRDMSQFSNDVRLFDALVSKPDRLAEAMTWRTNAAGNIELIALHFQDSGLPQMSCLQTSRMSEVSR